MKSRRNTFARIILAIALCLPFSVAQAQPAPPAGPGAGPGAVPEIGRGGRRIGGDQVDDRVQLRTYLFTNTDETLPYAVYVPSKYSNDRKTPLVLALHGMNGTHATFMRTACVNEAEKYGFILVGPMGYSSMGSFGMQFGMGGRGGFGRRGAPATNAPSAPQTQGTNQAARGGTFPGARHGNGNG